LCGSNSENKRSIVESIKIVFCHPETFDLEFVGTKTCLTQLICEQYALRLSISSCPPFFAALRGELKKGKFTHVKTGPFVFCGIGVAENVPRRLFC
jgi:hypothetical protein